LLGFKISSAGPLRDLWAIARAIGSGKINWVEFALGAATLAAILLVKSRKRFPGILVAMVGATGVVYFFDLAERANISVLGSLPRGLPTFSIPWIPFADLVPVLIGGFAVSLVSFADTSVLSRTYAARTGTRVDPNQEMVGLGAANLAAGLFQGFPIRPAALKSPRGSKMISMNGRSWRDLALSQRPLSRAK
jgi:MFS superfamily sulfate permease-like transporter